MLLRLVCFLVLWLPLNAQRTALSKGLEHFYNLEHDEAISEFRKDIAARPGDAAGYNHLAMAILYREMLRNGALESELVSGSNPFLRRPKLNPSPQDHQEFDAAIQKSMALSQERIRADRSDPQATYTLGVAYGLRANYNFLVRKTWTDSLKDATTARKLHSQVAAMNPAAVDARLLEGAHDYVIGNLPWHIRLLGFLTGFRGNKQDGIRTLELVASRGDQNRVDAEVLLCAIYRRERQPRKAAPLLEGLISRFPRNYLFRFEASQMYADMGNEKHALEEIQQIEDMKKSGYPGYSRLPLEKILYARGTVQFWYRDLDRALGNLQKVAARAQDLDLNTGTYAWLRVGQIYDLKGQRPQAVEAYQQSLQLAPDSDAAKLCRQYLSAPYRRPAAKR